MSGIGPPPWVMKSVGRRPFATMAELARMEAAPAQAHVSFSRGEDAAAAATVSAAPSFRSERPPSRITTASIVPVSLQFHHVLMRNAYRAMLQLCGVSDLMTRGSEPTSTTDSKPAWTGQDAQYNRYSCHRSSEELHAENAVQAPREWAATYAISVRQDLA